jgi:hypothetical protein
MLLIETPTALSPVLHERHIPPARAVVAHGTRTAARTLDEVLTATWSDLLAHRSAPCPACGGNLAPRYGAGEAPRGGRCVRCATTLAAA